MVQYLTLLKDWDLSINYLVMKKNIKVLGSILKKFSLSLFLLLTLYSHTALAAGSGINYELKSPLAFNSIEGLLVGILNVFMVIATPIIIMFIIYAGFLYVTAKGNAEQVKKATTALTYAVIGGVILLGAVAISEIVKNVVGAFTTP